MTTTHDPRPSRLGSWLERLVDVHDEEVSRLLWSIGYFFFLLLSYYILRPIRDEMGLHGGVRNLPYLYLGTLAGVIVAHPIFTWLVTRYPRKLFVPITYRCFAVCILLFFAAMRWGPETASVAVARTFFVWVSVFNMFVVSIFWGFMADLWSNVQGKRLFGLIGAGGTAGAIAGSWLTAWFVQLVGAASLLLVSALLLEVAVQCVRRLERSPTAAAGPPPAPASPHSVTGLAEAPAPRGRTLGTLRGVVNGVWLVLSSTYLAGICAYIFLFTITSTFLYFEQANIVDAAITDRTARTSFFAWVDVAVNVLTLAVQLFLTGRIMRWLGVPLTLAVLPALTIAGFSALALAPTLVVVAAFSILRRGMNYAVARPAREVLYTVVGREEKYKAKNFIDTFVYRGGDALAAFAFKALNDLVTGLAGVALIAVPIAAVWGAVGLFLGRRQRALAEETLTSNRP
ncbi:MAG: MFS transporter [Acidobacteriota bacterium]|nr:MFS transporter [Acidobacteriota bacterium]